MLKMSRAQRNYNRRIKRTNYELGDLVLVCHPMLKKGLSKGLAPRYYGPFQVVGKYENGCDFLIKNPSQPKSKVKQIHVNNLKTYFDRGQPKPSSKPTPAQESNTSTEDEIPVKPNSRNHVQNKTDKLSKTVLVSDKSQRESSDSSESQSETELEGDTKAVKTYFTQGIFWRPIVSKLKPTVKRKLKILKNKKVATPNAKNCEKTEITRSADKTARPESPSPKKSRSGRVIKPGQNLKQL